MFVLFVDMRVKPGAEQALEATYSGPFREAITRQDGFRSVELLRPNKDGGEYRLCISFATRAQQKTWVATDLHQQVWPQMEAHSASHSIADYTAVEHS
jgi:heme-degrading monooxygenase HmoA